MRYKLAVEKFDRRSISVPIVNEIMQLYRGRNAHGLSIPYDLLGCCGRVEIELYPFEDVDGRSFIWLRILSVVEPHQLDDESFFVHSAGWRFPAVLIESDTAVFRDPAGRICFF